MSNLENLVGTLATVSFFKHTPETALKDIIYGGQVLHFPAGSILYREGEPASGMHVLLKGQVHLCRIGLQGSEYIVHVAKSVVMFNEVTVIDGLPNPVTAVADQDCTTWQVSYDNYQMLLKRYPELGIGLAIVLAGRTRALLNCYEDLVDRPVLARTAKLLLTLSDCGRKSINRYDHSNQRMAALATTVPEAVSRSLKNLKDHGVIETSRSQIRVLSTRSLTDFALLEPVPLEYRYIS